MMTKRDAIIRAVYGFVVLSCVMVAMGTVLLLQSKTLIFSFASKQAERAAVVTPFPVSVDPTTRSIVENETVETFFTDSLATAPNARQHWWNQVAAFFADDEWYQNLASPVGRIVVIWPGERKEEVTKKIGDILRWDSAEREAFMTLVDTTAPLVADGKYYPGSYVAHRYATPADMHALIYASFTDEILEHYTADVESQVPLKTALTIASLLEREASDFENMREVSGVIWNRIFKGMPLQLDATLQYIKGSDPYVSSWWPAVHPNDKYTDSPFNTYKHAGLPPAPIANPSAEAILAALNPAVTDCLFYFHAANKQYYCSATYEEHVSKLRSLYGRGR